MADVTAAFKRLFLRSLLWGANSDGVTLSAKLQTLATARIDASQKGKVLVASAGNGHSNSYQIPSDFTSTDAVELCSEMLDRYDEASAKLIADGTASPTDQQIHDEMLKKIQPVRTITYDFTDLRTEPTEVTT